MAIKIVTLTLGRIIEQDDGFVVKITGVESKRFTDKDTAKKYLDKHAPKRYKAGLWANGKLTWKTFKRKHDAEDYLCRRNIEVTDGTYRPIAAAKAKATFAGYADIWRNKYLIPEEGLKASTRSVRQYCLDKHLIGSFGPYALKAISPNQITDFRADLLKDGKSTGQR